MTQNSDKDVVSNNGVLSATDTVYDSDMMSQELDGIKLNKQQRLLGILRLIICSAIGLFVFFGSMTVDGESQTVFSIIYNAFVNLFGGAIYWVLVVIIGGNLGLHVYYKYVKKGKDESLLAESYSNDKFVHTILYALGFMYILLYALHTSFSGFAGPEIIVGASTGGSVIPPVVKGVFGIVIAGAVFMPFLLNYGILEIVGAILEPLMRPVFKVPGKSALDATASFVSSSSLGVLITNRLWKKNVYTDREMVAIMTSFSAVSIGFASLVCNTAGVGEYFLKIYIITFVMVFLMEAILVRVPPISRKRDVHYDGTVQTEEDRKEGVKFNAQTLPLGGRRAVTRAAIARGIVKDTTFSLKDSLLVLPQVLTMLAAIGVTAMILAEYTPVFNWLGYIFQPLLSLFQVPDAAIIAPSMPVGIAEMMLPVLVMNSSAVAAGAALAIKAKIFVVMVSIVQIIFFSETATVMMATKSPIKFWEIIVCFLERTALAIPLCALAIHVFF